MSLIPDEEIKAWREIVLRSYRSQDLIWDRLIPEPMLLAIILSFIFMPAQGPLSPVCLHSVSSGLFIPGFKYAQVSSSY